MSFGEVRSLLQQAPDKGRWGRICEILGAFDRHTLDDMVFPYVTQATRRWPDELCVAPQRWVLRALEGEDVVFWSIVRTIDLSCNYLDKDQLFTLLASGRLSEVTIMDLDSNRIGKEGARVIGSSEHLVDVHTLRLGYNAIGDDGLEAIVEMEAAPGLVELNVERNGLTTGAMAPLSRAHWLPTLERLNLRDNPAISARALGSFLRHADLGSLRSLELTKVKVTRTVAHALAQSQALATGGLEHLDLFRCGLDDDVLRLLAEWPGLAHVRSLELGGNEDVTVEGVEFLAAAGMPELRKLGLGGVSMDDANAEMLAEAAPKLERVGARFISWDGAKRAFGPDVSVRVVR